MLKTVNTLMKTSLSNFRNSGSQLPSYHLYHILTTYNTHEYTMRYGGVKIVAVQSLSRSVESGTFT